MMLNYVWVNTSSSLSHELYIWELEMKKDNPAHEFEEESAMGMRNTWGVGDQLMITQLPNLLTAFNKCFLRPKLCILPSFPSL